MNFLAHLYLAGEPDAFGAGNVMGDFVRGRVERLGLPAALAQGVRLHRFIDGYSDGHPLVAQSRRRLARPRVSGVIVDMAYDHFLARHWHRFHSQPLPYFTADCYAALAAQWDHLPPRLGRLLPVMRRDDWLARYGELDFLARSLDRMAARLRRPELLLGSIDAVMAAYEGLERDCLAFLPEARATALAWEQRHRPIRVVDTMRPG